jgi:predicted secreted protein
MARPTTIPFKDFILEIGNGATPEVFGKPCGLTSQGINFTKETNEQQVPDCDDPDLAAATERAVTATSATFTGEGILAAEFLPEWWAFYNYNGSRNCTIELVSTVSGGTWSGKFILSGFNVTANLGEKVSVAVEMLSDGVIVFTPAVLMADDLAEAA